jgi:hypothetical protein
MKKPMTAQEVVDMLGFLPVGTNIEPAVGEIRELAQEGRYVTGGLGAKLVVQRILTREEIETIAKHLGAKESPRAAFYYAAVAELTPATERDIAIRKAREAKRDAVVNLIFRDCVRMLRSLTDTEWQNLAAQAGVNAKTPPSKETQAMIIAEVERKASA